MSAQGRIMLHKSVATNNITNTIREGIKLESRDFILTLQKHDSHNLLLHVVKKIESLWRDK